MATATRNSVPAPVLPPDTITLELSLDEADALVALTGQIAGKTTDFSKLTDSIYTALDAAVGYTNRKWRITEYGADLNTEAFIKDNA